MIRLYEILAILRKQSWNTMEIRLLRADEKVEEGDILKYGHVMLEDMSIDVIEYAYDEGLLNLNNFYIDILTYDEYRESYVVFVREVFRYDE